MATIVVFDGNPESELRHRFGYNYIIRDSHLYYMSAAACSTPTSSPSAA